MALISLLPSVVARGRTALQTLAAAYAAYGGPVITVDFGTATTFGVVKRKKDALWAAPLRRGSDLGRRAHQPHQCAQKFCPLKPRNPPLGTIPTPCNLGASYGFTGLTDGILKTTLAEMPGSTVVGTGGQCEVIASRANTFTSDKLLTPSGVKRIYQLNF